METLTSKARRLTNLTAMQTDLLRRLDACFPFVADLTHAHLSLFVHAKESGRYAILAHYKPHTLYTLPNISPAGTIVAVVEEPLISYTFKTGKNIYGKREVDEAEILDMYTFPIRENGEIIAVVSIETNHQYMDKASYNQLLQAAQLVFYHARKPSTEREMFKPIVSGDGILIADKTNRIVYTNSSAMRIYKALGIINVMGTSISGRCFAGKVKRETVIDGHQYEKEMQIGDITLLRRDIHIEEGGVLQCRIILMSDITEMRKKDKEIKIKSAVMQEIHDRVKNNLQTIASLLRMQARRTKSPEAKEALKEGVNRILSISIIHEFLSQQDDEIIDVMRVAKSIMDSVCQSMLDKDFGLFTDFKGPEIKLPSKNASKLSLVINEMILNAIEHGFENRFTGVIVFETAETDTEYVISICDDGNGLPEDFDLEAVRSSLGLYIVNTIVTEEMGGKFELIDRKVEFSKNGHQCHGTRAKITIPKEIQAEEADA